MIPKLLLALAPVGFVLILSELLWRKKVIKGEAARKFIHILAGCWMAFWPLYLPFDGIFVLGCIALTLLIYSRITKLFHAIYAIKRRTYGDLLFAVAIVVCAYLAKVDWIFTVSILFLSLADGGAALFGKTWGVKNQYFVFGKKALTKSIIGTLAFLALAYISIGAGWIMGGEDVMRDNLTLTFVALPLLATIFENSMPFGFDNIITPLTATIIFNSLV